MNLKILRKEFTPTSTLGDFFIDEKRFCHSLEDGDKGLTDSMTLEEILKIKVKDETAIGYGHYEVILGWSNHFQKMVPHILNVKGFSAVEIHNGSFVSNTRACPLLGYLHSKFPINGSWEIYQSVHAFNDFLPLFKAAILKGRVYIDIVKA